MKTKLLLTLSILMLLAVTGAYGQQIVKANIPFQFIAAGRTLPAGLYEFIRDVSAETIRVVGTNKNDSAIVPIITRLGGTIHTSKHDAHVVFDTIGEVYTLSEIWVPGEDGFLLITTKGKHEHRTVDVPTVENFTFKERLQWYTKITYTDPWRHVWLVGGVTADDFLFDGIEKWGSGLSGWGKSLAAVQGQRVVANTTELLIGRLIGDDARYRPSGKKGLTRRVWYATTHAFTARASSGNTRPAYSRCIAVTTGILVANQWRPEPKTGSDLARTLIFGITDKIQDDLLDEFSPDLKQLGRKIWRKVHHSNKAVDPSLPRGM